jgi:hypothetical protein
VLPTPGELLDFAVLYSIVNTDVASGPTAGACETESLLLSLTVSYHR